MSHDDPGDCKEIFAMLSEYLDAELQPGTCEQLERHLSDCPPCIEFMESLKRTVQFCRQEAVAETPPPLTPQQKARLREAFLATRQEE